MVIWPKKNSKMGAAAGSRRKSSPPWEVERGLRAGPSDGARPLPTAPDGSRPLPRSPEASRRLPTAPDGSRGLPTAPEGSLTAPEGSRRAWGRGEPSGSRPAQLPGRPPLFRAPPARHGFVPLLSSAAFRVVLFVSRREATGEHTDPACRAAGRGGGSALGTGRRRPPPGARQPEGAESGPSPRLGTRKPQRSTNRRSASPCDASQSARRQPRAAAPASPPPGGSRLGRPSRPERGPAVGFPAHLWTPAFSL